MNKNSIYDRIIELGGDCFQKGQVRPPCSSCPFQEKCIYQMLTLAKSISKESRVEWALQELVEDSIFKDN